jgi:hypothetical protein
MRRHARLLPFLAVCLLVSTAAAHAECSTETADPVGAHDNRQECEQIAQAIQRPDSGYTKTAEGLYAKKYNSTLRVHGLFKCLPDTVDPRRPKAGTK